MNAEPGQYVIADLLANAIEPWDNLTARELEALGARMDPGNPLADPIVIAAYRNERGPVLIEGSERLQWLASPPRNQKVISADEVRIDPEAIDPESAHLAAIAFRVSGPHTSPRAKAELARRLQTQLGWSHATIAEVFKVPRQSVANWLRPFSGEVPEITGADGRTYPARGRQAEPDLRPAGDTVSDALTVLRAEHQEAVLRLASIRHIRIDRQGSADPRIWTVTIPSQSASAGSRLAGLLRDQANDLISLASKLEQGGT
jgi:hypothetical protein